MCCRSNFPALLHFWLYWQVAARSMATKIPIRFEQVHSCETHLSTAARSLMSRADGLPAPVASRRIRLGARYYLDSIWLVGQD